MVTWPQCPLHGVVCPAWPAPGARPRDPAAGRPGLPRPGRRAAVPARRRRHRRPPRHRRSWPASGIAAVVLQTAVGLCVFLAYGTTASVARQLGAGDLRGALAQGIDGVWLAVADRRGRHRRRASRSPTRWSRPSAPAPTVADHGDDVPADRLPRHHPAAGHARRDRRAARAAGHPHPAGGRRRRQRCSTSCSTCCSSTAPGRSPGSASPAPPWARCWPRWPAPPPCVAVVVRAARREGASLRPDLPGIRAAAHAGGRPGRPHPDPARRAAGHDVRRRRSAPSAGASRRSTWPPTSSR